MNIVRNPLFPLIPETPEKAMLQWMIDLTFLLQTLHANVYDDFIGIELGEVSVYIRHDDSTAANDFLVGAGTNQFVKKTLAEVLIILAHTIASHSDTSATGAELNILTDGSNADTLHTHDIESTATLLSLLLMGA